MDTIDIVDIIDPSLNAPASRSAPLPRAVRRAVEAMRADPARDWSLDDLAALDGVSVRTLQRQFRAFTGLAPHAMLRDLRFGEARRALLSARGRVGIAEIALAAGLPHLGRFSTEYRRRYGETPTQTLSRQRALADAIGTMPSFLPGGRAAPVVALVGRDDAPEASRALRDALATALTRSGAAVTTDRRAARYELAMADGAGGSAMLKLSELATGTLLWAHRLAVPADADIDLEATFALRIAARLQPCLRVAEIERARRVPAAERTSHDLTLLALPGVLALDARGNASALERLDAAIERDAGNALATALAAWARAQRVVYHFGTRPAEERERSLALAAEALGAGGDAAVLAVVGTTLTLLHELDAADRTIGRALAADGGSAWAWSRSGWIDVYRDRPEVAIERFRTALELAPDDPLAFNNMVGIGCAHFAAGRYAESAAWQMRALAERPSAGWIHRTLCPALVRGGRRTEAERSRAALQASYPGLGLAEVQRGLPPLPRAFADGVIEALAAAGLR